MSNHRVSEHTGEKLEWFNESYKDIVQSNNLLLVTNGVILAALITLMSEVFAPKDSSLLNYSFINSDGTFTLDVPIMPLRVMLIVFGIVLPILISIGFSIGSINSGLYPRNPTRRAFDNFSQREKNALKWYSYASICLSVGIIGVFALFTSFVIERYSLLVLVICLATLSYLVIERRVFRDYKYLPETTEGSTAPHINTKQRLSDGSRLSPEGPIIHLQHCFGPITIHTCGEVTEVGTES